MPRSDGLRASRTAPPATDRPEPPLSDKEREVVKSYGGWTAFCESHGLKPWEPSDKQEALSIVKALASHD